MSRPRSLPDAQVFASIQSLLDKGGDKAVSFGTVSAATGLSPATLVQRYRSRDDMVRAARIAAWEALESRTAEAIANTSDKGPHGLLKAIGPMDGRAIAWDMQDPVLVARATGWRAAVEKAIALRMGGGSKAEEAAAVLFAAWQGLSLWANAEAHELRLKSVVKRLT